MSYGSLLGWSAAIIVLVVIIQGFWKNERRLISQDSGERPPQVFALDRWGAFHTALSIALTLIIVIHGLVFFGALYGPSFPIWLGASAVGALLILNASGVFTESKRKSREFGPLRRIHVVLMVIVLALSFAHIELLTGGSFLRMVIEGGIVAGVMIVVLFVFVRISVHS